MKVTRLLFVVFLAVFSITGAILPANVTDKILTGTKPAEIPVEVNPKMEFAINRQAARALRLTIASEV